MKKLLNILLFLTGMSQVDPSVPPKYILIQQRKTWSDAQASCRLNHSELASIESPDDVIQLQMEAQSQLFNSSAWIGLYNDINSWRWSFKDEPLGNQTNWFSTGPDNWGGDEECALLNTKGWFDAACGQRCPFICFDDRYTGTASYIYYSTKMSWRSAQTYCRQHHSDLASSRNETENSMILGKIAAGSWFGLFRDSWKWSDQTNYTGMTWMPGQPDNGRGSEACAYLNNGQAADALCSDLMPYFCSPVVRKRQILRINLQSDQGVDDPAGKATVLERILLKLKDNGIINKVKVTWRKKADGDVFKKLRNGNGSAGMQGNCGTV